MIILKNVEERDDYSKFLVSSKKDIQSVINFYSFSDLHPLMGHKLIQYNNWISGLQKSSRYCSLNFPK
jgi:hypothetical protein